MNSFGKSFYSEFIEMYKNEPALWQTKSEAYKNVLEKKNAYNRLLEKCKEVDKDATIDDVKKKINHLRTAYRREFKKVEQSLKNAESEEDIYKPSLWYFNKMQFLGDYFESSEVEIKSEIVSPPPKRPFVETDYMEEELEHHTEASVLPLPKKPKFREIDFLRKAVRHLEQSTQRRQEERQVRDEAAVFGEGWTLVFRKLTEEQKIYAKRIIDETLMFGQLQQLNYTSSVNIGYVENHNNEPII